MSKVYRKTANDPMHEGKDVLLLQQAISGCKSEKDNIWDRVFTNVDRKKWEEEMEKKSPDDEIYMCMDGIGYTAFLKKNIIRYKFVEWND